MTDNSSQIDYWNGDAGLTWANEADAIDRMLEPFGRLAIEALGPVAGARVLDIGCGAGATSRALAALGAEVIGIDVSGPLVALARAKAGGPAYLEADAAASALPGPFDAAFSRFGVMFFGDPTAAFEHLRSAMTPTGRIAFVCWGPMPENSWALEPMIAAMPHLPAPPEPPIPGAPGPFAFAEPGRAVSILKGAGWRNADAKRWRGEFTPFQGDALAAAPLMLKIGPLGRMLREHPSAAEPVRAALLDLLNRRMTADGARFEASVWIVTAHA